MCYKKFYSLLVFALLFSSASLIQAAPVAVNLDFSGPNPNNVEFNGTAQGTVTTKIFGKIIKFFTGSPNPQTDAISLFGDSISATFSGNPVRNPVNGAGAPETSVINFDGSNLWTPLNISDMNLTLLDGGVVLDDDDQVVSYSGNTIPFSLDTLVLEVETTPPGFFDPDSNIKIDVGGRFVRVDFFQGANGQTINPDGTYAIEGTLRGVITLELGVNAFGGSLAITTGLGTQDFDTPFTLTGTLDVDNTTATDADLKFDGIVSGGFVLSGISTTITFNEFGAQASLSLDALGSIDLTMEYHVEDTAHVPEPGTFALLGLGALGLVPLIRKRVRKS